MPVARDLMPAVARRVVSGLYSLLWCAAGPLLFLSPRMRQGWRQRLGFGRPAPSDVWIQGASAGECALVASLLEHLPGVRVLATSCTSQGLDVLRKANAHGLQARMLPLDLPQLMGRILDQARPRAVVLLNLLSLFNQNGWRQSSAISTIRLSLAGARLMSGGGRIILASWKAFSI